MDEATDTDASRDASDPTSEPPVDDGELLVDRYGIDERLGSGGQGVSYRGTDTESGRDVVVKRLAIEAVDQWKTVELFERSMEVLQKLDHSRIPDYVDAFERQTDGDAPTELYIVRDYAPGRSLRDAVDDGERFTEEEVRSIARDLLETLDYLHGRDPPVVHRDIKPGNVVRGPDGGTSLVDFGAVQESLLDEAGGSTVVGTTGYVPPEQLTGDATPKSDLYAVGATLVHLLTHKAPSDLPVERMTLQFREHADVPESLATWLDGLLAPDPEARFETARRALDALDNPEAAAPRKPQSERDYPALTEGPPENSEFAFSDGDTVEIVIPGTQYALHDRLVVGWLIVGGLGLIVGFPFLRDVRSLVPLLVAWFTSLVVSLIAIIHRLITADRDTVVEIDDTAVRIGKRDGSETIPHYSAPLDEFPGLVEAPFQMQDNYESDSIEFFSHSHTRQRVLTDAHSPSSTFASPNDDFLVVVPPDRDGWESDKLAVDMFPFAFDRAGESLTLAERQWLIDAVDQAVSRAHNHDRDYSTENQ